MRAVVFACLLSALSLASLAGCIDNDRVRVQSLSPGSSGTFTYRAQTDTVMTENDDGAAERIRRDWLAQTLAARGMCNNGYVVYQRRLDIAAQRPALAEAASPASPAATSFFGNGGDVVYTGGCL
ncbi:MAG TPA: hypothetical protein VGM07_00900 [Stellaceae bacterium]|jgi:hypothetical protein